MNGEVFSAILALDSYNRGYAEGINLPDTGGHIGSAITLSDSLQLLGQSSKSNGFYASSYIWTHDGTTVVPGT